MRIAKLSAKLFFLDSEPTVPPGALVAHGLTEDEENFPGAGATAAWIDSDDERITISLATNTRLRKLRNYEGEDIVNGKEYTKRLRRQ